jgi:hypothetical protein
MALDKLVELAMLLRYRTMLPRKQALVYATFRQIADILGKS